MVHDGYRSHFSVPVLEVLTRKKIVVYAFPAHSSVKTKSLDVTMFSVFRQALRPLPRNSVDVGSGHAFNAFNYFDLLAHAHKETFTPAVIMLGFRRAGIWPLNHSQIWRTPKPATF